MKDLVLIKSYAHGITLIINAEADFDEVLDEIKYKFAESRKFFKDSKMALSIEGRELTNEDEKRIVEAIHYNSDLKILCIVDHDEEAEKSFVKAVDHTLRHFSSEDAGQFYKGSLINGAELETESSIVILGDVNPGCSVTSAKNIIIIGGLYGEAYAGASGDNNCYVVALEMEPSKIKIGDFRYNGSKSNKWGIHKKIQPKIAHVKNTKVVFDGLTKDLLDSMA